MAYVSKPVSCHWWVQLPGRASSIRGPQGTVLGPLSFLLYINDLGEHCTSRMRLFADDTLIYSTIESCNDAAKLQSDLTALQEWAQKWQMKFNPSKCHVLRISRKQNPVESNYVLMGKVLDSVTHHPYLGVELSRNLDWGQHVNNKVMKANLSLGFLRRNLSSCPEEWKRQPTKPLWAASRGIRKLSLGPTLKKTRQTNRESTKKSRTLR